MQAVITQSVIDSALRFPHIGGMLTHDEIRDELIRQIDAGQIKQAKVAERLGVAPARIAEVRKDQRRIQPREMPILAELLGMSDVGVSARAVESVHEIPNLGRVAQGMWLEQSHPDDPELPTIAYDRMRGDPSAQDLFAVTPVGTSMNLAFMPGTILICRRIPFGEGVFRSGDYVIAQRTAHDLTELTCKRVEMDADGACWLHSESTDAKFGEPWCIGSPDCDQHDDMEIVVIGKVIRAVRDFERN